MKKMSLFDSQRNEIHVYIYEPKSSPIGVVQIIHGAVEHFARYGLFAEFLNKAGYVVVGCDILGHGLSSPTNDYAHFADKNGDQLAYESVLLVKDYVQEKYPNIDLMVIGHSMGSFLARKLVIDFPNDYKKAIWSGTALYAPGLMSMGIFLANLIISFKGPRHLSKLIDNMAIGSLASKARKAGLIQGLDEGWLTKDEAIQEYYHNSPMCGQPMTVSANRDLFRWIKFISLKKNWMRMNPKLPIFIASGAQDPLSDFGKTIPPLYQQLKKAGFENVEMKLYSGDRHEILNELDRDDVYQDMLIFLKK
ncbi:MAG: alpha/beta hydrolase [Candidatus Izemoplasmatales bacterium]|nr:alpha/beta hydrolase [Candidatus Izemoplasmatales bacterium]MDD5602079.1 alpha/beta hydrolase [Candidatus Izemoplasmatales bacterium]